MIKPDARGQSVPLDSQIPSRMTSRVRTGSLLAQVMGGLGEDRCMACKGVPLKMAELCEVVRERDFEAAVSIRLSSVEA